MISIKKVAVSPLPKNNGVIIDSFNTSDNKHTNAPSLFAVSEKLKEISESGKEVQKEMVMVPFAVRLQIKDSSGIYRDNQLYGTDIKFPIIFHKYGNNILLTMRINVILADVTTFEYNYSNSDNVIELRIPIRHIGNSSFRLNIYTSEVPEKYKMLGIYTDSENSDYRIADRAKSFEELYFLMNTNNIAIYLNRSEACSWNFSFNYFGANTN